MFGAGVCFLALHKSYPNPPFNKKNITAATQKTKKKVAGGYYSPASYMAAALVLDGLLLRAAPALLFGAVMYPMVGLPFWGCVFFQRRALCFCRSVCVFVLLCGRRT
jgi:hypothetical protein